MPDISIDTTDAAELTELLQLLRDWLAAEHNHLDASPASFIGHPAYDITQLLADLDRFTFLLGGNDGEPLFNPR